jgi:FKBP-type peptidyl-prolyl cis-trans isomerase
MRIIITLTVLSFLLLSGCLDSTGTSNDICADFDRQAQAEFLEQNSAAEGIVVTESGLQYRVIEEGDGESPGPESVVSIEYTGRLIDGTVFDSTDNVGEVSFGVNQVIPGFAEGLQLMSVGATYEFYLPPDLGYGENPPLGTAICPGAALIFEVQLNSIE